MIIIKGKYNEAKIFIEDTAPDIITNQIKALCDMEILADSTIRIMPDVCPGIGTTIGSTFTFKNKIIPSLVSGDIGCGITTAKLKNKLWEPLQIDRIIREQILERKKINSILEKYQEQANLDKLICKKYIDIDRCLSKLIDLGGGNHFLEIDKDDDGYLYITVHSGSRLLGQQIYDYYINEGYRKIDDKTYNRLYTYLDGDLMKAYLHDMKIAIDFASLNRMSIIETLCKMTKNKITEVIESIHNYADDSIIRKGAISAKLDEHMIIPISASPIYGGIIIGTGLGNEDWNFSAPHGAGRICSRGESENIFSFNEYKKEMKDVHSISVIKETIDEAPMVYKKRKYIEENIKNSVKIEKILIPIYNYKNSSNK